MKAKVIVILLIICCIVSGINVNGKEITDTWVATDALGRVLPDNKTAGDKKQDKYVGIFYFLFLDTSYEGMRLSDKSYVYRLGGKEAVWDVLVRGGIDMWGKPYFGYYENTDEWIYRKHAAMLSAAGVDFIFLDITNPNSYDHAWRVLFKVWQDIRDEGGVTPQIIFNCGDDPVRMQSHIGGLWSEIYSQGKYKDLWFMWEGKPLIFGNPDNLGEEVKSFFSIRKSWAFNAWTSEDGGRLRWPWIAEVPQVPGRNIDGVIEQVSVTAGFHASTSRGRSFVNGKQTSNGKKDFGYSLTETQYGLAFKEQWESALEIDPPLITVTGWNEFHNGGSYITAEDISWNVADTYQTGYNDLQYGKVFVDCFSSEFSRDIEPIDGYYGDNYYYQLCYYIRLFKGVEKIPEGTGSYDIGLNTDKEKWDKIGPEFKDITNDTVHRDHRSVTGTYYYTNETGRNDFKDIKVSKLKDKTYFYVSCQDDIVIDSGENWMNLFIDSDQNHETGWEGYDYIINRGRDNNKAVIERFKDDSWSFEEVGKADYTVEGNTMVICVPNKVIKIINRDNFDFKWADNSTVSGNIMEFMDLGDSAPDSRFNFRYVKKGGNIVSYKDINIYFIVIPVVLILIIAAIFVIKKKTEKALFKKIIKITVISLLALTIVSTAAYFLIKYINYRNTITLLVREDISPNANMEKLKQVIDEYTEAFGKVKVKVKYVKDFPVDPEGDVLLIPADSALEYMSVKKSKLYDISKYIKEEEIIAPAYKMGNIKGSIQWIPFNYDRAVVLCDLNIFEKLGVKVPDSDWTYDDFVKTAAELTQRKDKVSYTGIYLPYHEKFVWMQFIQGFGGNWYDSENLKLNLTEGNSLKGINNMFSLFNKDIAKGNGVNTDKVAAMSLAFGCQPQRNGTYFLTEEETNSNPGNYALELAKENKLLVLPLPSFPEGNTGASNTDFIHGFAILSKSKKKDISIDFVKFSQTVEGQRILNKYYGGIPTNIDAQKEDFWKTGTLTGINADNVLKGIEYDKRDDFFDAYYDSIDMYNNILRSRVMFSAVLYNKFESIDKGDENGLSEEGIELLKLLEKKVSLTMKLADRE